MKLHLVRRQARPGKVEEVAPRIEGLAGWLVRLIQSLVSGKGVHGRNTQQMLLVETLALGGRKHLMLVSCGGERFMIGSGPDCVDSIVQIRTQTRGHAGGQTQPHAGAGERN